MKLYFRLARLGISKNTRFYAPYILTCIGAVMLQFNLFALSDSPYYGRRTTMLMQLGAVIFAVFSLLLLINANSFLVKRRYKEFGFYNVLGMDKKHISLVIVIENLMIALGTIFTGTLLGIITYKLFELGLVNFLGGEIGFEITINRPAIRLTALIFLVIHAILIIISLVRVGLSKPIELLKSESRGEKPPKANWVLALIGLVALGAGYYISVTAGDPIEALELFFVAVALVIVGTDLLFRAGSVALCRLLQKNKRYYYKKHHFISVSSMAHRMKRNGGGLAMISILATTVLVTISSTTNLYFGIDDIAKTQSPTDVYLELNGGSFNTFARDIDDIRAILEGVIARNNAEIKSKKEFPVALISGVLDGDSIKVDKSLYGNLGVALSGQKYCGIIFMEQKDFNSMYGSDYDLAEGEAVLSTYDLSYNADTIDIEGLGTVKIVDKSIEVTDHALMASRNMPTMTFVVPSLEMLDPLDRFLAQDEEAQETNFGRTSLQKRYFFGYDIAASDANIKKIYQEMLDEIKDARFMFDGFGYNSGCKVIAKEDSLEFLGSFYYLGIILSIAFVMATVLIIYYKQIVEGYEDQSRFIIMQKVGLTNRDIKKSVNSQVLTVFFAPLLVAGLHLCFAMPSVWLILRLFGQVNLKKVLLITAATYLVFAVIYTLIYKLTARSYYKIVS